MQIFSLASYQPSAFSSLVAGIAMFILALGVWVRREDPQDPEHRAYFSLSVLIFLILLFIAVPLGAVDQGVANFWDKIGWAALFPLPAAILDFELLHLKLTTRLRRWIPHLYFLAVFFIAFLPTRLLVDDRHVVTYAWGSFEQLGPLGYVFLLEFYTVFAICLVSHWRKIRAPGLSERQRKMYRLTFLAMLFAVLASSDFLGYAGVPWPPCSFIFLTVWMSLFASAILKYKLFRLTTTVAAPAIIESMPGALFVVNLDGEIVITNPYASEATLTAPEAMRDRDVAAFLPVAVEVLKQAKEKMTLGPLINAREGALIDAEGKTHPVAISASAIRDDGEKLRGVVFVAVGIEKLKEQMKMIGEQQTKLQADFDEMEKIQKMLVGREMKMVQLKKENEDLKNKH